MRLTELIKRLQALERRGFVETSRSGPTGIGHLLERELGLKESNVAIPDIGGRVEMKGTRRDAKSLITLFTFNKAVWKVSQKEILERYGYKDEQGRQALYNIVSNKRPNSQGFYLESDPKRHLIILRNKNDKGVVFAEWSTYVIAGKFMTKLDRLLLVLADNKIVNGKEHFHFNEAYLLENPAPENFLEAFERSEMMIDMRMHLYPSGGVRNHGTGFRISEKNLKLLYAHKKRLV
ncbi:MAG: MvaI/BcnI family restriction endonuclease [candidate division Zixibacteria bacterium]|nr:MvaI/BcnI family restriction endonuclease [candidate division Zixibacteria bacterium]